MTAELVVLFRSSLDTPDPVLSYAGGAEAVATAGVGKLDFGPASVAVADLECAGRGMSSSSSSSSTSLRPSAGVPYTSPSLSLSSASKSWLHWLYTESDRFLVLNSPLPLCARLSAEGSVASVGEAVIEVGEAIVSGSVVKGDVLMAEIGGASPVGELPVASVISCNLASTAVGETPSPPDARVELTSLRSTGVLVPILVGVPSPLEGAGGGRLLGSLDPLTGKALSTEAKDERSSRLATEDSLPPRALELEFLKIDESLRFDLSLHRCPSSELATLE